MPLDATIPSQPWPQPAAPITADERRRRLEGLRALMDQARLRAVLLGATSSLRYFTGLAWYPSERLVGALVTPGGLTYVCPRFELDKIAAMPALAGDFATWEEDENPYALVRDLAGPAGRVGLDENLPLFAWHGLAKVFGAARLADAGPLTNRLRRRKSPAEIALMQQAKSMTLEVHRRTHAALRAGVRASEVVRFIEAQHRALGAAGGNTFCIVCFGLDSSFPHGGEGDPALREGDVVLIDTGCRVEGYTSDITRTYVHGEPTPRFRQFWALEQEAQAAAFAAARLGEPCEVADRAARAVLEKAGLGPDYRLPGLPHRTGHGIGLDVHEAPNLVRGETTPLEAGMCFSNEPMIVVPGEFGIRLEDHFYMTEAGPRWFTPPQPSLDEPFKGVVGI
jgi:Xaa-Pro dipeptidase